MEWDIGETVFIKNYKDIRGKNETPCFVPGMKSVCGRAFKIKSKSKLPINYKSYKITYRLDGVRLITGNDYHFAENSFINAVTLE